MTTLNLTLADYAAEPNALVAGVAKSLTEESRFMDILPFADVGTMSVMIYREGGMPSVSWRNLGASHGSALATKPIELTENAFSVGNEIDVDKAYMKDKSARLVNPMTYQTKMITRAIARNFNNAAINGLPSDQKSPVGLWYRCKTDLAASQNVLAKTSGLDISPDATTLSANGQAMIDKLDELLYSITGSLDAGGNNIYLACNDTLMMRINSIFRQSGLLDSTKDSLGRIFTTYKGAKFIDMGLKYDDTNRIIGNVELADGSAIVGGASTSIYAFKTGKEDFTAWQEYALEVSAPELQADKVTYKSVIDWMVGLAISNPRSVARLYGIIAA